MGISAFGASGIKPGVCTSTTRPSAPYEGMMIYETDTDMLAIWNGSAWRYVAATTPTNGTVLQVVNATYSTETDSTSNHTTWRDTGLSASITPKSSNSKILIVASIHCFKSNGNAGNAPSLRLVRGSTAIQTNPYNLYNFTAQEFYATFTLHYLDSPSTTSSTTYKAQFANTVDAAYVRVQAAFTPSVMTLMEIAG